jgi:hypothetical protein
MKIDALDILCLNQPNQNLSGRYDVRDAKRNRVYCVKSVEGFPIDVRAYDDNYVYDNFTEGDPPYGWKDPRWFKQHTGNRMLGNKIMPRWIDYPFPIPISVSDDDSPFGIFSNNIWDGVSHSVLATKYVLNPPKPKDWGGDVKSIPTWLLQYFYNGKAVKPGAPITYGSMETYEYGYDPATKRGFGLLYWTVNASPNRDGKWTEAGHNTPSVHLQPFKGETNPIGQMAQLPRGPQLVRMPFLGIDGVV